MTSTADRHESLQSKIITLARMVLKNWRDLALLTAKQEGAYVFVGDECCFYVNESVLEEQYIQILRQLYRRNWAGNYHKTFTTWYPNPLVAWFLLLLCPIQVIGALLFLALCTL